MHEAFGFTYVVIHPDGKSIKPPVVFRGGNAGDKFLNCLLQEEEMIKNLLKVNKPLPMTEDEELAFANVTHCTICNEFLGTDRVRDHNHLSSSFRRAVIHVIQNTDTQNAFW